MLKYKSNLYDLHVKDLLYQKIKDFRHFRIVSCAVYFHCASQKDIEDMLVNPYKDKNKEEDNKYEKHAFTALIPQHFDLTLFISS